MKIKSILKLALATLFGGGVILCLSLFTLAGCASNGNSTGTVTHTHTYANGSCTICGTKEPSEGLEYTRSSTYYSVTGIGTCTDTDIVIPDTYEGLPVTSIGWGAFYDCSSLTGVTIPDGVTSIGYEAFCGCKSLTSITIPDSVTSIDMYAFEGCTNLIQEVNGVQYVDKWVVYCYESVTSVTLRSNTKGLASFAFSHCRSLTSITIPDSVTSIAGHAFDDCTALTDIIVDDGNMIYKDIDGNLYSKDGTKLIQYAAGKTATAFKIPDSVTTIGVYAFAYCTSLTNITMGSGITSIGERAFWCCTALTDIIVDDGNMIYKDIDGNLYSKDGTELIQYAIGKTATAFKIPDSVTYIVRYAFYGCTALTSVNIPDSVTVIGGWAFYYCSSLTNITMGSGITSIGEGAFLYCTSLTNITIPDGITYIGYGAFYDCTSLTSVTFSNTSGWSLDDGTQISSTDLADPATAAKYLTDTYDSYVWSRG